MSKYPKIVRTLLEIASEYGSAQLDSEDFYIEVAVEDDGIQWYLNVEPANFETDILPLLREWKPAPLNNLEDISW